MTATEPTLGAAPCSGPKTLPNDGRRFDGVTIRRFRGLAEAAPSSRRLRLFCYRFPTVAASAAGDPPGCRV